MIASELLLALLLISFCIVSFINVQFLLFAGRWELQEEASYDLEKDYMFYVNNTAVSKYFLICLFIPIVQIPISIILYGYYCLSLYDYSKSVNPISKRRRRKRVKQYRKLKKEGVFNLIDLGNCIVYAGPNSLPRIEVFKNPDYYLVVIERRKRYLFSSKKDAKVFINKYRRSYFNL